MAFILPTRLRNGQFGFMRRLPRGPQARLVVNGSTNRSLDFTDRLLVFVVGMAYLLSISLPLFGFQTVYTIFNHLCLVLVLPVLALHWCGLILNRSTVPWSRILKVTWPLVALALFALAGSTVAKRSLGVVDSYLSFGIYLILLPLFVTFTVDGSKLRNYAGALIALWALASLAAFIGQIGRPSVSEALHEIEYVVATGFLAMYYVARGNTMRWVALLMLIGSAVLNQKLTGFIIAALALVEIVFSSGWHRLKPSWRTTYALAAVVVVAALAAILTLLYFEYRRYLPSGNAEVRLAQYDQAWRQFQQSPVWGTAFLRGSGEVYRESQFRTNIIPTHSDVIDILKHGGLIGFALFTLGYFTIVRYIHRAAAATRGDQKLHAYFVSARFFLVTAFVTFAFNPILLKGSFLMIVWASAGLALGMSLAVLKKEAKSTAHMPQALPKPPFNGWSAPSPS